MAANRPEIVIVHSVTRSGRADWLLFVTISPTDPANQLRRVQMKIRGWPAGRFSGSIGLELAICNQSQVDAWYLFLGVHNSLEHLSVLGLVR